MPLIKTHCSLLAVDALVEAIYDYLVKTNAAIPADLEEKHRRIQKKTDIVDERMHSLDAK